MFKKQRGGREEEGERRLHLNIKLNRAEKHIYRVLRDLDWIPQYHFKKMQITACVADHNLLSDRTTSFLHTDPLNA